MEKIRNKTSYVVQNSQFSEEFKMGHWDGRKHLMTAKRKIFPTGLVSRVTEELGRLGIQYDFIDKRTVYPASRNIPINANFKFRDYQETIIELMTLHGGGVAQVATGGGKSAIGTGIISELGRPTIFLVHRRSLMYQMLDMLRGSKSRRGMLVAPEMVGQIGGGIYEPQTITVMMVQSACAVFDIDYENTEDDDVAYNSREMKTAKQNQACIMRCLQNAEVVVVDECHHIPANTIYAVLGKMEKAAFRYGLSATSWRDDGADIMIEAAVGPTHVSMSLSDLIQEKWLVPAAISFEELKVPAWYMPSKGRKWNAVYKECIVNNPAVTQACLDINKKWYNDGRTILTLVTMVAHGEELTRRMNDIGIPTEFLSGRDDERQRDNVLGRLRGKHIRSLVATSIADEGLDLPALDAVNLVGGGKSSTRTYQRIGRILRPHDGKSEGLVADYFIHGEKWLENHAAIRERMYRREPGFRLLS